MSGLRKCFITLSTAVLVIFAAFSAPVLSSTDDASKDVDKLLIIDCMLPGKIMRLGGGARYMSARRPIKTTGADCEIRGGEYVAYDRANYATSLNVWLPDAKAGDPKAQTYVGEMFEQGLGTAPDYQTAVAWYRKAAEQGFERAQMNLGSMYERGLGVEQNDLEALNWYRQATGMVDGDLVLGSEFAELEAEAEGLRTSLAASEAEVKTLKESLNLTQQEMNNSQARLDRARLELEELRYRANQIQSGGTSVGELAALNEQMRLKELELRAEREELSGLRSAFDQQQANFTAQLSVQDENEGSYQELLAFERTKIANQEEKIARLTQSLETRQSELNSSNEQLAALRRQLEARAERDQAALDGSIAELSGIIVEQQTMLEQKSQSISVLQLALKKQRESLAEEQATLSNRQQSLASNSEKMSAEQELLLTQERMRVASLQGEIAASSNELNLQQSSLAQSNAQLEVLQQQLDIANSKRTSSEESMKELAEIISAQQSDLEQKTLSISFLEQDLQSQTEQLASERRAYEQREQQLLENTDLVVAEQQSLMARLDEMQRAQSTSEQRLIESERLIQQQEEEIRESTQTLASLKENQDRQNSSEIRGLEAQLGEKAIELARAQGDNAALSNEKIAMERELNRLRNQITTVENSSQVAMRGTTIAPAMEQTRLRTAIPEVDFGNYYALIIGNAEYAEFPSLQTPISDARAMANLLEQRYGFRTQVLINASRANILEAIDSYRKRLTEKDNFLLYYAGHGSLDDKNNRGHWLPVDASPDSTVNWISNVQITDHINQMTAKHIMVIADSCYSGTLTREVRPMLEGGKSEKLAIEWYKQLSQIPSRTALTSGGTQPVLDGGGGDHSIFANSLLQALGDNTGVLQGPDLYREVFKRMRASGQNTIGQEPTFNVIQNAGDRAAPFFFVQS